MHRTVGYSIFGAIIGLVTRHFFPGGDHAGIIMTMVVGIAGALLGLARGRADDYRTWYHPYKSPDFLWALLFASILAGVYSNFWAKRG